MFRIILLSLAIFLQSCSSTPKPKAQEQQHSGVMIADGVYLKMTTPPLSLTNTGFQMLVKGQHGKRTYEMKMQVELAGDKIVMAATTMDGMQLFEYLWFGNRPYRLSKSPLAKDVDVRYLLSDFELVHWPEQELRKHLDGAKLVATPTTRKIIKDGKTVILIDYGEQQTALEHLEKRYSVVMRTVKKWDLAAQMPQ